LVTEMGTMNVLPPITTKKLIEINPSNNQFAPTINVEPCSGSSYASNMIVVLEILNVISRR
jgi:hypothetical protein